MGIVLKECSKYRTATRINIKMNTVHYLLRFIQCHMDCSDNILLKYKVTGAVSIKQEGYTIHMHRGFVLVGKGQ